MGGTLLAVTQEDCLVYMNITEHFIFCRSSAYKKLLEYLFWVWDPDLPGGQHEPRRVIQNGFMDPVTCKVVMVFLTFIKFLLMLK